MLRLSIPNAIALGIVIVAAGWLALRPSAGRPIGAPPANVLPRLQAPATDNNTLEALQATIAGLLRRLEILEAEKVDQKSVLAVSPSPAPVGQKNAPSVFQTQVIYLGSGSTTQRDWTETGAQTWLNSAAYPAGVNVVFEAGLSIIGGEAWARLKNKTTGAIISVSEVFHNNSSVTWKSSPQFKLHPGNNLYVVELKSSSDEVANLAGSRVQLSQ